MKNYVEYVCKICDGAGNLFFDYGGNKTEEKCEHCDGKGYIILENIHYFDDYYTLYKENTW